MRREGGGRELLGIVVGCDTAAVAVAAAVADAVALSNTTAAAAEAITSDPAAFAIPFVATAPDNTVDAAFPPTTDPAPSPTADDPDIVIAVAIKQPLLALGIHEAEREAVEGGGLVSRA